MKKYISTSVPVFVVLIAIMFLLAACGGGGDSKDSIPPLQYTGITDPAVINGTNAEELATGAFEGGSMGGSIGAMGADGDTAGVSTGDSRLLLIHDTASEILGMVKASLHVGTVGAELTQNVTQYGDCGGSLKISVTIDEITGDFTGNFKYLDYCSGGVTMNGGMTVSGIFDILAGEPSAMTMTFNRISYSSATDSFAMSGTVSYTFLGVSSLTMSMNIKVKDATGKVHWVKDYTLTVVEDTLNGYADITITSGRFFHPDHGYIDVVTESPLRIYDTDDYPSSGVMKITGDISAWLVCLSPTSYEVYVDTTGDGTYTDGGDWYSGPLTWN